MGKNNLALFDGEEESTEKLSINKDFAKKYKKFKECQELDKLKQKYGPDYEESSSDGESEDEDAEGLTPEIEQNFLKTLSLIKSKDPQIYEKEVRFFKDKEENQEEKIKGESAKKSSSKPLLLKDYERQRLLTKGDKAYVSDDDDDEKDQKVLTYDEEQLALKNSFKQAAEIDDEDDILKLRVKSKNEVEEEEKGYQSWLKKEKKQNKGMLERYWKGENLDANDEFLRDYILNKQYVHKGDSIPTYDEVTGCLNSEEDERDDEELEKVEDFEKRFNFRFEEPDQELIKRYPRTINETVRREDDKRKVKRKEREERKEREKEQKTQELKRLKKLKRKEIMEKIEKLKEITGNQKVGFLEDDLEGDFDAQKYDTLMQQVYDDGYYEEGEGEKPVFTDDEDQDGDQQNWDEWNTQNNEELHYEDQDFNMDADYVPTASKKSKKKSKLEEALQRKKPLFNKEEKTFEEYFDEYYKLDFEDIIGDMPVRFKYREVAPNEFGLKTEEILNADDKELNQWCPLRKTMRYCTEEEEQKERQRYKKKARDTKKKERLLPSLSKQGEEEDNKQQDVNEVPLGAAHKVKRLQSKRAASSVYALNTWSRTPFKRQIHRRRVVNKPPPTKSQTKKVHGLFKGARADKINKLSLERLAAYGLDKRKQKNKEKS